MPARPRKVEKLWKKSTKPHLTAVLAHKERLGLAPLEDSCVQEVLGGNDLVEHLLVIRKLSNEAQDKGTVVLLSKAVRDFRHASGLLGFQQRCCALMLGLSKARVAFALPLFGKLRPEWDFCRTPFLLFGLRRGRGCVLNSPRITPTGKTRPNNICALTRGS